jgi:hypothetical protein
MFKTAQYYKNKKEKGQTLIIVIVIMVLALSVGITVSSRYIKTLRDISESDNATRALAVAEAAVENVLMVSEEDLEQYIASGVCDVCTLEITGESGYRARADVELSHTGFTDDFFEVRINEGEVFQLSLVGYDSNSTIDVCWDGQASIYGSYIYEQSPEFFSQIYTYNPIGYSGSPNGFLEASPLNGHENCFSVSTVGTPRVLRIKPYNEETFVYFYPASGQNIPSQGILITSVGRSGNAIRTVKVLKTTGMVPEFFDYVIYQKSLSAPLSNRPD